MVREKMSNQHSFSGLQPVVRIIKKPGEVVSLVDKATGCTRFVRAVETSPAEGRQILEVSDSGTFSARRVVSLTGEKPFDLWPDVKARFFFDVPRTTRRTCFFVRPEIKVNRQEPRRAQRNRDAAGPNIRTGIEEIPGRRAVDKLARVVTGRTKVV